MGINVVSANLRDYFGKKALTKSHPYEVAVFCDGVVNKWTANLANNEVWIDASAVSRQGIQQGMGLHFKGPGTCQVYAMMGDRKLANLIKDPAYAALPAKFATSWTQIGDLSDGESAAPEVSTYDLIRAVFTGVGCLRIASL